jgi:predicted acetyltransferase
MPGLSLPTVNVKESFLAAMAEFAAEGRGAPDDSSTVGHEIRDWSGRWDTVTGFALYLAVLRAEADEDTPRPAGRVPCTTWWWVDGEDYLGRIALRHRLTPGLLEAGGHIGYDVRPPARRRGHATAMLTEVLPVARDMGIDRALLTCLPGNVASRRVIESCGGVLEDERGGLLRFWVPTGRG